MSVIELAQEDQNLVVNMSPTIPKGRVCPEHPTHEAMWTCDVKDCGKEICSWCGQPSGAIGKIKHYCNEHFKKKVTMGGTVIKMKLQGIEKIKNMGKSQEEQAEVIKHYKANVTDGSTCPKHAEFAAFWQCSTPNCPNKGCARCPCAMGQGNVPICPLHYVPVSAVPTGMGGQVVGTGGAAAAHVVKGGASPNVVMKTPSPPCIIL